MSRLVGAYLCPRGVSVIECKSARKGLEILNALDVPARIASERQGTDHLVRILQDADIKRADIAVVVRGFGFLHHILGLPPAPDELLAPIVEREVRRLEPLLDDPVVGWLSLPRDPSELGDGTLQHQKLVVAAPRQVTDALEQGIRAAGHRLLHLTALPAAYQRLHEEFIPDGEPMALVAPLRDGAFLGFFLGGGLRLVVEPPAGEDDQPDATALAEEVELGAMFVRQQFRGAQIARVTLAASQDAFDGAESALTERLGVPADRIQVRELDAGGLAALGGILDARSAAPLALGGTAGERHRSRSGASLRKASYAALIVAALLGGFAMVEAFRARDAALGVQAARRRIEQESFGMMTMRETANHRKLIRDAVATIRLAERDRRDLQSALVAVGSAVVPPVRLDTMSLTLGSNGWVTAVGGSIFGQTNARAVELLHEFYRDLPRRVVVEELMLEQLTYADGAADDAGGGDGGVRFQVSFVIPFATKKQ